MKKLKKTLSVLFTVIFVWGLASPAKAFAASDFTVKTDKRGEIYVSAYSGKGGSVTVPSKVKYIADEVFKGNTKITSLTVPNGCSVGSKAFESCVNLKTVTFKGKVPYIDKSAFANCTSLEKVIFEDYSAEISFIEEKAFMNCFKLSNVKLPENTKSIGDFAFGNCSSLGNIIIPASVSKIGDHAVGYMYDEKNKKYIKADGETTAYVSFSEYYNGKIIEWYSAVIGDPLVVIAAKKSAAETYAKKSGLKCAEYVSAMAPMLSVESSDTESITLKWTKISGNVKYRLSILENGKYKKYSENTATKCKVTGLAEGTEYTFKLSVLVETGRKKYAELSSAEVKGTTAKKPVRVKDSGIPDAPKVSAEATKDTITLRWKSVKKADAYRIEIYNKEKKSFEKYKVQNGCFCEITGLESGKQYTVRVVSLYKVKKNYLDGGTSASMKITTSSIVTG